MAREIRPIAKRRVRSGVLFEQVAQTSAAIAQASARKKKVALLAELMKQVPAGERAIAARYLSGDVGRKLGISYATVHEVRVAPAATAALTLTEVDARLAAIAAMGGAGSQKARKDGYGALLAAAT